jgi:hypothetical protein
MAESLLVGNLLQAQHIWASVTTGAVQTFTDAIDLRFGAVDVLKGFQSIWNIVASTDMFHKMHNNTVHSVHWYKNPRLAVDGWTLDGQYYQNKTAEELIYKQVAVHPSLIKEYKRGKIDIPYPGWQFAPDDVVFGDNPPYDPQPVPPGPPVAVYVAKEGDTFQTIAKSQLGDVNAWPVLVALNGGTESDFLAAHKPIHVGAEVKVPNMMSTKATFGSSVTDDPYLTDYLMGADGDFVSLNADLDDVQVVTGPLCLKQGLTHRLTMQRGESLVYPKNGLAYGAGDTIAAETSVLVANDIRDQVKSDPRILGYKLLDLVDSGDGIEVNCKALVVSGASITLSVPVD